MSKGERMCSAQAPASYVGEFCARTRRLREASGKTQKQMAIALGITPDAYRKNEDRSPLPHYLIPRFAAIVGCSIEFLMTGQSRPSFRRSGQGGARRIKEGEAGK